MNRLQKYKKTSVKLHIVVKYNRKNTKISMYVLQKDFCIFNSFKGEQAEIVNSRHKALEAPSIDEMGKQAPFN